VDVPKTRYAQSGNVSIAYQAVGDALGIHARAGLHTGECEVVDGKVAGIAEVLVSSTVKDLVAGSGLTFDEGGIRELKGVPGEWRLYSVATTA